jgi:transposase-like protein
MSKHRICSKQIKVAVREALKIELPMPVLGILVDSRQAFHELCVETGCRTLLAMMEADRAVLCGPKGRHNPARRAYRAGSAPSRVTLGGRQIELPRLRARGEEGELSLASFRWAARRDALDAHTLETIAAGASTRQYARTLDPLSDHWREHATSRSAVSRRFIALTTQQMHEFLARPLAGLDLRIVFIDGKLFREHCLLIALGLDRQGRKHVLGLREGSTENARVATALLADLVARGLNVEQVMLFVIDGAKALRRAIREVFGELAIVQRCQVHKLRNVLEHLPQHLHPSVSRALHDAWSSDSADLAQRQLERLAKSLEREHPGAASSLREGLQDTLTVQRLGLTGALARTLKTTNPIENLNGSITTYIRNVKRWRHGAMIQRWVAAALREAEKQFRRVRGYRDMPRLIAALDAARRSETRIAKIA